MNHRILVSTIASAALILSGCSEFAAFQNSPATQAAETVALQIGLSLALKSPAFASLAPIAVSSLTALANGANRTAITGVVTADAPKIIAAVSQMIPNSAGKAAAVQIAQAYVQASPSTPARGNAVLSAIASGLNTGVVTASTASNP